MKSSVPKLYEVGGREFHADRHQKSPNRSVALLQGYAKNRSATVNLSMWEGDLDMLRDWRGK